MTVKSVIGGTNPFCSDLTGAIKSQLEMTAFIDGSYMVTGSHRMMPDVEVYWRYWRDGRYRVIPLHRERRKHPSCLFPLTPNCEKDWSVQDLDGYP